MNAGEATNEGDKTPPAVSTQTGEDTKEEMANAATAVAGDDEKKDEDSRMTTGIGEEPPKEKEEKEEDPIDATDDDSSLEDFPFSPSGSRINGDIADADNEQNAGTNEYENEHDNEHEQPKKKPALILKSLKGNGKGWSKLKTIVRNTSHAGMFRGSLTGPEQQFLQMRNTSKSKRNNLFRSDHFVDVVELAVARDKLRKSVNGKLSKLTVPEAQFLQDIVDDDDVTLQQLEKADHVLKTDPLYKLPHEEDYDSINEEESEAGETSGAVMDDADDVGDGSDEEDDDDLDVSIEFEDDEIEIFITSLGLEANTDSETSKESESKPLHLRPSTYSYKTWDILQDQPSPQFPILGMTNDNDIPQSSRVLSPPMMSSLRNFLPHAVAEDNFWLKFSLARDGSSLEALYNSIRQSTRTLLAIETVDGEVFGAFVSSPWRAQRSFYGSCEAFLWRMTESRFQETKSLQEQVQLEEAMDIFLWSRDNRNIQMSDRSKIVVGGGQPDEDQDQLYSNISQGSNLGVDVNANVDGKENNEEWKSISKEDWGLGIALGNDLFKGTSSPCITFRSPTLPQRGGRLSSTSNQGVFEVCNLEVWSFTPCQNVKEAEQLEFGRMFVLSHFDE